MNGQFQKPPGQRSVEYGNPFDLLLGQAFKPRELKAYREPTPAPEMVVAIDICAICGEVKCTCKSRKIVKLKV